MRTSLIGLSAFALAAAASPALAQEEEPASDFTFTGNATVVTDYRFRGISQTNEKFAIQGGVTAAHESGFYLSIWGSSVDDYVAAGSDQEIDLIAGYSRTFGVATFDLGVLYYYYPGSGGVNTDFFEPYVSVKGTLGPVTAKLGAAYAPKQKAIASVNTKDDNLYVYTDLSGAIPNTPLTLTGHFGYSKGRSFLTGGLKDYMDWNVGVAYTWKNFTFGVSYVDTDLKRIQALGPTGRNLADAAAVGTISVAF